MGASLMRRFPAIALLVFLAVAWPFISRAQDQSGFVELPLHSVLTNVPPSTFGYDFETGTRYFTYILIRHGDTSLIADKVALNTDTGQATADGHVHIERAGETWVGSHIVYNLKTGVAESGPFRIRQVTILRKIEPESGSVSKTSRQQTTKKGCSPRTMSKSRPIT